MTTDTAPLSAEKLDEIEALARKLDRRLKHASRGDRSYERPMAWDEADLVVGSLLSLLAMARSRPQDEASKREVPVGWETAAEWELEQRAFQAANDQSLPADARKLIADLWRQYCLFRPAPVAPSRDEVLDEQMTKFLEGVVGIVEASSYEKLCLWEEYHQKQGTSWKENQSGFLETVGFVGDRPVCVDLQTIVVDGLKLLFMCPTSQVVDHLLVDEWLKRALPEAVKNRTDAMNFHNVLRGAAAIRALKSTEPHHD